MGSVFKTKWLPLNAKDGFSFWFCMRRSRGMHLSFAGWRCSLHPSCPSTSWHLSPLEPRCIANEGLVNHTPVCRGKQAGGSAPWLIPSPLFLPFSICLHPSILLFCLNKPSPFPYPSDFSLAFHFSSPLSFSSTHVSPARHCASPAVCTSGWGRPEHMAEAYLRGELVRRCELNPWLISEHDTVREPSHSANTSEDCVCASAR